MLRLARDDGKQVRVVATETRPYLQGARLTACSVSQLGLDVTLIADSVAAYCIFKGLVNKVFTAADRISLDGWVANKIGTYQLAIAAVLKSKWQQLIKRLIRTQKHREVKTWTTSNRLIQFVPWLT